MVMLTLTRGPTSSDVTLVRHPAATTLPPHFTPPRALSLFPARCLHTHQLRVGLGQTELDGTAAKALKDSVPEGPPF